VIRIALLALVPLAPLLEYVWGGSALLVFAGGIAGIAVLAEWIRFSTEQLALHLGPAVGSLVTISLGSLAELLLALFVLASGQAEVVHAQITGSIMATSLLGLGLAILVGGITRERQEFRRERAGLLSSLLILLVIALLLPALFDYTARSVTQSHNVALSDEELSLAVSVVLLLLYGANLLYTLVTHHDVFATGEEETSEVRWPVWATLLTLHSSGRLGKRVGGGCAG
jgi:Ca2+:H+ antiporter